MTIAPINGDTAAALGLTPTQLPLFLREEWKAIVGEGYERIGIFNKDGQAMAASVDFAKLPESLQVKAVAQIDKIQVP